MLAPRMRSAVTLLVLLGLLLVGVAYGFSAVTEPFDERQEPPICSAAAVKKGEKVYPDQVTVSVLNAGTRTGLAGRTMSQLADEEFGRGELGDAPEGADVRRAEIWTEDPSSPAVRLVRTYLGKKRTRIVRRDTVAPGVNVVVGDKFQKLRKGRQKVTVKQDGEICSPPVGVDRGESPVL